MTLFKPSDQTSSALGSSPRDKAGASEADPVREALNLYSRAMERLKAGDWAGFGAEMDRLREVLEELCAEVGDGVRG